MKILPILLAALLPVSGACAEPPHPQEVAEAIMPDPGLSARAGLDWRVRIEPMLWAPALGGDFEVEGDGFDVEWIDADEVNLAPAGRVTIAADDWRFMFEGFSISGDGDETVRTTFTADGVAFARGTESRLDLDLSIFKLTAGKEVWRKPFSEDVALALDLYAGARLIDIDMRLENSAGAEIGGDGTWIEPLLGFNFVFELPRGFDLRFALDAGVSLGDDIGFDWQVISAFGWRFHDNAGIEIGFRHMSIDVNDDDFGFDGWAAGLFGSIVIYF